MEALLLKYQDQIEEIAVFARVNGFNPNTQFNELMKAWVKMTYERSICIEKNKADVMQLIKQSL